MQSTEDLEQDIDSLSREISSLTRRRDELKALRFERECSELSNHPVVKNFASLFNRFPSLYDALARESRETDGDDKVLNTFESETSVSKKRRIETGDGSASIAHHNMFDKTIASLIDTSPSKRLNKLQTRTRSKDLESKVRLENAYRLFGITFFPVVDPSDLSTDDTSTVEVERRMLGIRLEVFNEYRNQFEKPHYILLKQHIKSTAWELFKDTIPIYMDLENIFSKVNGGIITTYDDVYLFSKQVFIQLLAVSVRLQYLEELEESGLVAELEVDLQISVVSFVACNVRVQLLLQDDEVTSCITADRDLHVFLLGPIRELKHKLQQLNAP